MCSSPHWQVGLSWFREKCLRRTGNKGYRGEQISRKIVSRELGPRSYSDFAKNIALLGAKKMGSNMRPRYIQFRDIRDRDISGLHCIDGSVQACSISIANALEILQSCTETSIL